MANENFFPEIRLKEMTLDNFRGLSHINISFDEKLTVFIGANGSGKSTILDGIARMLYEFVQRTILDSENHEVLFQEKDIMNGTDFSKGNLELVSTYEFFEKKIIDAFRKGIETLNTYSYAGEIAVLRDVGENDPYHIIIDKTQVIELEKDIKIPDFVGEIQFAMKNKKTQLWELSLNFDELQSNINLYDPQKNHWGKKGHENEIIHSSFEFNRNKFPDFSFSENQENFKISLTRQIKDKKPVPYFAYYGGNSVESDFNSKVEETNFKSQTILKDTLIPKRFSLNALVNWFIKKQRIAQNRLTKLILDKYDENKKNLKEKAERDRKFDEQEFGKFTMTTVSSFSGMIADQKVTGETGVKIEEAEHIYLVKEAILAILNDDEKTYTNVGANENNESAEIFITKLQSGIETDLNINQLSSGERNLLALIGDIAIRLIQLNPTVDDPFTNGRGIVLIDEIDLHLHPNWQRKVVPKLRDIFPNIQFVISTHSPIVVSSAPKQSIRRLNHGNIEISNVPSYGQTPQEILENYFGFTDYPYEIKNALREIEENPDNRKNLEILKNL